MKFRNMTFTGFRVLMAAIAVLALVAEAFMLYSFSYAPLWAVFTPIGIALAGSFALILFRVPGSVWLTAAALVADVLIMRKLGVLPLWLVLIPAGVSVLADIVLYDVAKTLEFLRRMVVSLKRKPSMIPLVMLLVSFLVFSLNLTDVADTTAKIQGRGMGLCQFCIMLLSLLSMVCMLNAFPRRKKPNIPMIILMFAMFGVMIYCNIHYCNAVLAAVYRAESPIKLDDTTIYIRQAYNMLGVHMVLVIITAALVALLPVYSKLLKKINTSIAVDDNGQMAEIEITD